MTHPDPRIDPRFVRSRALLAAAVLELASERPIGEVTVAEVATRAQVNRSTFYQHASSPAALPPLRPRARRSRWALCGLHQGRV